MLTRDIVDYAKDAFRMGTGVGLRLVADYSRIPVDTLRVMIENGRDLEKKPPSERTDGETLLVDFFDATKNEARFVARAFSVIDTALDPKHPEGARLARWVVEEYAKRGLALAEIETRSKSDDGSKS